MNQTEEADKFEKLLQVMCEYEFGENDTVRGYDDTERAWSTLRRNHSFESGGHRVDIEFVQGGSEGDGELHFVVAKHTSPDSSVTLWKKNGWYASYEGAYLDGSCDKVEARNVTVTRYEKAGENG